MTKETFLNAIQGEAKISGCKTARVWEHAINIDHQDKRWSYIESESMGTDELVQQYCKYFGVEYQKPIRKARRTQVERWTKKLEELKAMQANIQAECMDAFMANIADVEQKLAHAVKNDL